ncbi:MAG: dephospho-CoA kinase [Bacillota bacterium]|nr:dephospho-CoA kinase [Bacillota bacterium]
MKIIGLTGGIGTGKSTAAAYLKSKGFAHIDADEISRGLTADGSPMLRRLERVFGPAGEMGEPGTEILLPDGRLDRKALASLVFSDEKKRKKLDEMMFGEIIREIDRQIEAYQQMDKAEKESACAEQKDCEQPKAAAAPAQPFHECFGILLDAPLLFEGNLDQKCDLVILLTASEQIRIDRVCQRDGVTAREVRNRINSQMSDEDKKKRADIIIDNSGSQKQLYERLDQMMKAIART